MPRLAPLEPPYEAGLQVEFDRIMKGADPLVLFRTVAVSDRAWRKFTGGSLLDRGPLSLREREIVIDRTCALNGCEYEWGVHVSAFAEAARLTAQEVAATAAPDAACDSWSAAERTLIAAVDALQARSTLSAAEFTGLGVHYDTAQVFEIIQLCGFYRTVSFLANALDLPLEPLSARFPATVRASR
jgi:alkylhydroperoxidase family enzyme